MSRGTASAINYATGESETDAENISSGYSEHLRPIYEDVIQLASREFQSYTEFERVMARRIRNQGVGEAIVQVPDDPTLFYVKILRNLPSYVGMSWEQIQRDVPRAIELMDDLFNQSVQSEMLFDCGRSRSRIARTIATTFDSADFFTADCGGFDEC